MRALPEGWPATDEPDQASPRAYFHMVDGSWPPASTTGAGESLPDGWAEVGQWEEVRELQALLLPGQVRGASGFATATGSCTIKHPDAGMFAPWRRGTERVPAGGECELWLSHDGYDGSTAFLLGSYILAPIKGRALSREITLDLKENLAKFQRPHNLLPGPGDGSVGVSGWDYLVSSAERLGFAVEYDGSGSDTVQALRFPGEDSVLSTWRDMVSSLLGAFYLSPDGQTAVLRTFDYLSGDAAETETLDVLTQFEDLQWSMDPGEVVDRIVLTYIPATFGRAVIWTAADGLSVPSLSSITVEFDPTVPVPDAAEGQTTIDGNAAAVGGGTASSLPVSITVLSSGRFQMKITNPNGSRRYLVTPAGLPSTYTVTGADTSTDETKRVLTWGATESKSVNPLSLDMGHVVQSETDAQNILNRVVSRVSTPSTLLPSVRVLPHVGRELTDVCRVDYSSEGLNSKALVTSLTTRGGPGYVEQAVGLALLPLLVRDFNEAWDLVDPSAIVDDFNDHWNSIDPSADLDAFNDDPMNAP